MENLLQKKCGPCQVGMPPMPQKKIDELLRQVPEWKLTEGITKKGLARGRSMAERKKHGQISRDFEFDDFLGAMKFVNKVAEVAESEGHHPDIFIYYNRVHMDLWTHESGGLFDNDFIVAAKINALLR